MAPATKEAGGTKPTISQTEQALRELVPLPGFQPARPREGAGPSEYEAARKAIGAAERDIDALSQSRAAKDPGLISQQQWKARFSSDVEPLAKSLENLGKENIGNGPKTYSANTKIVLAKLEGAQERLGEAKNETEIQEAKKMLDGARADYERLIEVRDMMRLAKTENKQWLAEALTASLDKMATGAGKMDDARYQRGVMIEEAAALYIHRSRMVGGKANQEVDAVLQGSIAVLSSEKSKPKDVDDASDMIKRFRGAAIADMGRVNDTFGASTLEIDRILGEQASMQLAPQARALLADIHKMQDRLKDPARAAVDVRDDEIAGIAKRVMELQRMSGDLAEIDNPAIRTGVGKAYGAALDALASGDAAGYSILLTAAAQLRGADQQYASKLSAAIDALAKAPESGKEEHEQKILSVIADSLSKQLASAANSSKGASGEVLKGIQKDFDARSKKPGELTPDDISKAIAALDISKSMYQRLSRAKMASPEAAQSAESMYVLGLDELRKRDGDVGRALAHTMLAEKYLETGDSAKRDDIKRLDQRLDAAEGAQGFRDAYAVFDAWNRLDSRVSALKESSRTLSAAGKATLALAIKELESMEHSLAGSGELIGTKEAETDIAAMRSRMGNDENLAKSIKNQAQASGRSEDSIVAERAKLQRRDTLIQLGNGIVSAYRSAPAQSQAGLGELYGFSYSALGSGDYRKADDFATAADAYSHSGSDKDRKGLLSAMSSYHEGKIAPDQASELISIYAAKNDSRKTISDKELLATVTRYQDLAIRAALNGDVKGAQYVELCSRVYSMWGAFPEKKLDKDQALERRSSMQAVEQELGEKGGIGVGIASGKTIFESMGGVEIFASKQYDILAFGVRAEDVRFAIQARSEFGATEPEKKRFADRWKLAHDKMNAKAAILAKAGNSEAAEYYGIHAQAADFTFAQGAVSAANALRMEGSAQLRKAMEIRKRAEAAVIKADTLRLSKNADDDAKAAVLDQRAAELSADSKQISERALRLMGAANSVLNGVITLNDSMRLNTRHAESGWLDANTGIRSVASGAGELIRQDAQGAKGAEADRLTASAEIVDNFPRARSVLTLNADNYIDRFGLVRVKKAGEGVPGTGEAERVSRKDAIALIEMGANAVKIGKEKISQQVAIQNTRNSMDGERQWMKQQYISNASFAIGSMIETLRKKDQKAYDNFLKENNIHTTVSEKGVSLQLPQDPTKLFYLYTSLCQTLGIKWHDDLDGKGEGDKPLLLDGNEFNTRFNQSAGAISTENFKAASGMLGSLRGELRGRYHMAIKPITQADLDFEHGKVAVKGPGALSGASLAEEVIANIDDKNEREAMRAKLEDTKKYGKGGVEGFLDELRSSRGDVFEKVQRGEMVQYDGDKYYTNARTAYRLHQQGHITDANTLDHMNERESSSAEDRQREDNTRLAARAKRIDALTDARKAYDEFRPGDIGNKEWVEMPDEQRLRELKKRGVNEAELKSSVEKYKANKLDEAKRWESVERKLEDSRSSLSAGRINVDENLLSRLVEALPEERAGRYSAELYAAKAEADPKIRAEKVAEVYRKLSSSPDDMQTAVNGVRGMMGTYAPDLKPSKEQEGMLAQLDGAATFASTQNLAASASRRDETAGLLIDKARNAFAESDAAKAAGDEATALKKRMEGRRDLDGAMAVMGSVGKAMDADSAKAYADALQATKEWKVWDRGKKIAPADSERFDIQVMADTEMDLRLLQQGWRKRSDGTLEQAELTPKARELVDKAVSSMDAIDSRLQGRIDRKSDWMTYVSDSDAKEGAYVSLLRKRFDGFKEAALAGFEASRKGINPVERDALLARAEKTFSTAGEAGIGMLGFYDTRTDTEHAAYALDTYREVGEGTKKFGKAVVIAGMFAGGTVTGGISTHLASAWITAEGIHDNMDSYVRMGGWSGMSTSEKLGWLGSVASTAAIGGGHLIGMARETIAESKAFSAAWAVSGEETAVESGLLARQSTTYSLGLGREEAAQEVVRAYGTSRFEKALETGQQASGLYIMGHGTFLAVDAVQRTVIAAQTGQTSTVEAAGEIFSQFMMLAAPVQHILSMGRPPSPTTLTWDTQLILALSIGKPIQYAPRAARAAAREELAVATRDTGAPGVRAAEPGRRGAGEAQGQPLERGTGLERLQKALEQREAQKAMERGGREGEKKAPADVRIDTQHEPVEAKVSISKEVLDAAREKIAKVETFKADESLPNRERWNNEKIFAAVGHVLQENARARQENARPGETVESNVLVVPVDKSGLNNIDRINPKVADILSKEVFRNIIKASIEILKSKGYTDIADGLLGNGKCDERALFLAGDIKGKSREEVIKDVQDAFEQAKDIETGRLDSYRLTLTNKATGKEVNTTLGAWMRANIRHGEDVAVAFTADYSDMARIDPSGEAPRLHSMYTEAEEKAAPYRKTVVEALNAEKLSRPGIDSDKPMMPVSDPKDTFQSGTAYAVRYHLTDQGVRAVQASLTGRVTELGAEGLTSIGISKEDAKIYLTESAKGTLREQMARKELQKKYPDIAAKKTNLQKIAAQKVLEEYPQLHGNEKEAGELVKQAFSREGLSIQQFAQIVPRKGYLFSDSIQNSEGNTFVGYGVMNGLSQIALDIFDSEIGKIDSDRQVSSRYMGNLSFYSRASGPEAENVRAHMQNLITANLIGTNIAVEVTAVEVKDGETTNDIAAKQLAQRMGIKNLDAETLDRGERLVRMLQAGNKDLIGRANGNAEPPEAVAKLIEDITDTGRKELRRVRDALNDMTVPERNQFFDFVRTHAKDIDGAERIPEVEVPKEAEVPVEMKLAAGAERQGAPDTTRGTTRPALRAVPQPEEVSKAAPAVAPQQAGKALERPQAETAEQAGARTKVTLNNVKRAEDGSLLFQYGQANAVVKPTGEKGSVPNTTVVDVTLPQINEGERPVSFRMEVNRDYDYVQTSQKAVSETIDMAITLGMNGAWPRVEELAKKMGYSDAIGKAKVEYIDSQIAKFRAANPPQPEQPGAFRRIYTETENARAARIIRHIEFSVETPGMTKEEIEFANRLKNNPFYITETSFGSRMKMALAWVRENEAVITAEEAGMQAPQKAAWKTEDNVRVQQIQAYILYARDDPIHLKKIASDAVLELVGKKGVDPENDLVKLLDRLAQGVEDPKLRGQIINGIQMAGSNLIREMTTEAAKANKAPPVVEVKSKAAVPAEAVPPKEAGAALEREAPAQDKVTPSAKESAEEHAPQKTETPAARKAVPEAEEVKVEAEAPAARKAVPDGDREQIDKDVARLRSIIDSGRKDIPEEHKEALELFDNMTKAGIPKEEALESAAQLAALVKTIRENNSIYPYPVEEILNNWQGPAEGKEEVRAQIEATVKYFTDLIAQNPALFRPVESMELEGNTYRICAPMKMGKDTVVPMFVTDSEGRTEFLLSYRSESQASWRRFPGMITTGIWKGESEHLQNLPWELQRTLDGMHTKAEPPAVMKDGKPIKLSDIDIPFFVFSEARVQDEVKSSQAPDLSKGSGDLPFNVVAAWEAGREDGIYGRHTNMVVESKNGKFRYGIAVTVDPKDATQDIMFIQYIESTEGKGIVGGTRKGAVSLPENEKEWLTPGAEYPEQVGELRPGVASRDTVGIRGARVRLGVHNSEDSPFHEFNNNLKDTGVFRKIREGKIKEAVETGEKIGKQKGPAPQEGQKEVPKLREVPQPAPEAKEAKGEIPTKTESMEAPGISRRAAPSEEAPEAKAPARAPQPAVPSSAPKQMEVNYDRLDTEFERQKTVAVVNNLPFEEGARPIAHDFYLIWNRAKNEAEEKNLAQQLSTGEDGKIDTAKADTLIKIYTQLKKRFGGTYESDRIRMIISEANAIARIDNAFDKQKSEAEGKGFRFNDGARSVAHDLDYLVRMGTDPKKADNLADRLSTDQAGNTDYAKADLLLAAQKRLNSFSGKDSTNDPNKIIDEARAIDFTLRSQNAPKAPSQVQAEGPASPEAKAEAQKPPGIQPSQEKKTYLIDGIPIEFGPGEKIPPEAIPIVEGRPVEKQAARVAAEPKMITIILNDLPFKIREGDPIPPGAKILQEEGVGEQPQKVQQAGPKRETFEERMNRKENERMQLRDGIRGLLDKPPGARAEGLGPIADETRSDDIGKRVDELKSDNTYQAISKIPGVKDIIANRLSLSSNRGSLPEIDEILTPVLKTGNNDVLVGIVKAIRDSAGNERKALENTLLKSDPAIGKLLIDLASGAYAGKESLVIAHYRMAAELDTTILSASTRMAIEISKLPKDDRNIVMEVLARTKPFMAAQISDALAFSDQKIDNQARQTIIEQLQKDFIPNSAEENTLAYRITTMDAGTRREILGEAYDQMSAANKARYRSREGFIDLIEGVYASNADYSRTGEILLREGAGAVIDVADKQASEKAAKSEGVFAKGERENIKAQGVEPGKTGGIRALYNIMNRGIDRGNEGPLKIEGNPDFIAGPHGPYYVTYEGEGNFAVNFSNPKGLKPQIPPNQHTAYIVPSEFQRMQLASMLALDVSAGRMSAQDAAAKLAKVVTYAEYGKSPPGEFKGAKETQDSRSDIGIKLLGNGQEVVEKARGIAQKMKNGTVSPEEQSGLNRARERAKDQSVDDFGLALQYVIDERVNKPSPPQGPEGPKGRGPRGGGPVGEGQAREKIAPVYDIGAAREAKAKAQVPEGATKAAATQIETGYNPAKSGDAVHFAQDAIREAIRNDDWATLDRLGGMDPAIKKQVDRIKATGNDQAKMIYATSLGLEINKAARAGKITVVETEMEGAKDATTGLPTMTTIFRIVAQGAGSIAGEVVGGESSPVQPSGGQIGPQGASSARGPSVSRAADEELSSRLDERFPIDMNKDSTEDFLYKRTIRDAAHALNTIYSMAVNADQAEAVAENMSFKVATPERYRTAFDNLRDEAAKKGLVSPTPQMIIEEAERMVGENKAYKKPAPALGLVQGPSAPQAKAEEEQSRTPATKDILQTKLDQRFGFDMDRDTPESFMRKRDIRDIANNILSVMGKAMTPEQAGRLAEYLRSTAASDARYGQAFKNLKDEAHKMNLELPTAKMIMDEAERMVAEKEQRRAGAQGGDAKQAKAVRSMAPRPDSEANAAPGARAQPIRVAPTKVEGLFEFRSLYGSKTSNAELEGILQKESEAARPEERGRIEKITRTARGLDRMASTGRETDMPSNIREAVGKVKAAKDKAAGSGRNIDRQMASRLTYEYASKLVLDEEKAAQSSKPVQEQINDRTIAAKTMAVHEIAVATDRAPEEKAAALASLSPIERFAYDIALAKAQYGGRSKPLDLDFTDGAIEAMQWHGKKDFTFMASAYKGIPVAVVAEGAPHVDILVMAKDAKTTYTVRVTKDGTEIINVTGMKFRNDAEKDAFLRYSNARMSDPVKTFGENEKVSESLQEIMKQVSFGNLGTARRYALDLGDTAKGPRARSEASVVPKPETVSDRLAKRPDAPIPAKSVQAFRDFSRMDSDSQNRVIEGLEKAAKDEEMRGIATANMDFVLRVRGFASQLSAFKSMNGETGFRLERALGLKPGELSGIYLNEGIRDRGIDPNAEFLKTIKRSGLILIVGEDTKIEAFPGASLKDVLVGMMTSDKGNLIFTLLKMYPEASKIEMKPAGGMTGVTRVKITDHNGAHLEYVKPVDLSTAATGDENLQRAWVPTADTVTKTPGGNEDLGFRLPDGTKSAYGISRSMLNSKIEIAGVTLETAYASDILNMHRNLELMKALVDHGDAVLEQLWFYLTACMSSGSIDGHEGNTFAMLMKVTGGNAEELRSRGFHFIPDGHGGELVFMFGRIDTDDSAGSYWISMPREGSIDAKRHINHMGGEAYLYRLMNSFVFHWNTAHPGDAPLTAADLHQKMFWQPVNYPGRANAEPPAIAGARRWMELRGSDPAFIKGMEDGFRAHSGEGAGISFGLREPKLKEQFGKYGAAKDHFPCNGEPSQVIMDHAGRTIAVAEYESLDTKDQGILSHLQKNKWTYLVEEADMPPQYDRSGVFKIQQKGFLAFKSLDEIPQEIRDKAYAAHMHPNVANEAELAAGGMGLWITPRKSPGASGALRFTESIGLPDIAMRGTIPSFRAIMGGGDVNNMIGLMIQAGDAWNRTIRAKGSP